MDHPDVGAIYRKPNIDYIPVGVSFFGIEFRFFSLPGTENLHPSFYVRERENPEEGEAPIELVIGISGAEKMAFTPMVVLRSSSERVLDDVYKIVDYSRLTHATTAGPDAAVFVASRNPNEIHPLEVSGQFPDGCHIYGAPQILVRPDASLIIIPQEAISAQAPIDLNNPAITPGMAR